MWLESETVLSLAGYSLPVPLAGTAEERALLYAQTLIEAHTGLVWGEERVGEVHTVRLSAASYLLALPLDTVSVSAVASGDAPLPAGAVFRVTPFGLESDDAGGLPIRFAPGSYRITLRRGVLTPGQEVQKAASLLVAHYLRLSDDERSTFADLNHGDFGGSMRLSALPVPEAQQLLRRYSQEVALAL